MNVFNKIFHRSPSNSNLNLLGTENKPLNAQSDKKTEKVARRGLFRRNSTQSTTSTPPKYEITKKPKEAEGTIQDFFNNAVNNKSSKTVEKNRHDIDQQTKDDIGKSLIQWEKSLKKEITDRKAEKNKEISNKKLGEKTQNILHQTARTFAATLVDKTATEASFCLNHMYLIPPVIGFKCVAKLDLRYNMLRVLSNEISSLENLKEIDFSSNEIKRFPNFLLEMPNLMTINASHNPLEDFPNESNLKDKKTLVLSNNYQKEHAKELENLKAKATIESPVDEK